jgi:hypothetical protein
MISQVNFFRLMTLLMGLNSMLIFYTQFHQVRQLRVSVSNELKTIKAQNEALQRANQAMALMRSELDRCGQPRAVSFSTAPPKQSRVIE